MFMNLHSLPVGKHMFTVYVTNQPVGTPQGDLLYDEIDVMADHGSDVYTVVGSLSREDRADYAGCRVVGVVDQSDRYVLHQDADLVVEQVVR